MKNVSFLTNPDVVTIEQSLQNSEGNNDGFSLGEWFLKLFIGAVILFVIGWLIGAILEPYKATEQSPKRSLQPEGDDDVDSRQREKMLAY